jgi:oligoribonuclease NrnB/cAMP/cGMP phosphodiesterase (DHH superfamily)
MDIIYYHGHCPDGWCAAFIASKRYPEAELVPLDHGTDFDFSQVEGKDVLMVDFSLRTRQLNDNIAFLAKSFRILDHHRTAQAVLEGAPYATFDMKRSGAGLTWDYLFGKELEAMQATWNPADPFKELKPQPRPWFVDYVEDRDLWNWALPMSKEICAYLGTLELNKEDWDKLDSVDWNLAKMKGVGALAHINHYVREAVKQAQTGILRFQTGVIEAEDDSIAPVPTWIDYRTAVLNVPYLNCSEIGNELAKTHDVSLTWFERADGMIQFSLRSIGDIDVSKIAQVFRGGGHKNASGFQLPLENGRQVVDRILGRANEDPQAA